MKKLIFIVLGCLFMATDCKKKDDFPPCELPPDAFNTPFTFQLVSTNGQTLIGESGALYESTDVKVTDSEGSIPPSVEIGSAGIIGLIIPSNGDETDEIIKKDFFLILPPTGINPNEDVDTISTTYKLLLTECNVFWYQSFEVTYNDSLYHSGEFPANKLKFIKQ